MKKSLVAICATVTRIANHHGATQALSGSTAQPNRASTGTGFGIRHAF